MFLTPRKRLSLLFGLFAITLAVFAWKHFRHRTLRDGVPISGGAVMNARIPAPLFKQWDRGWSEQRLGNTNSSMASIGCTVCSLAMALSSKGFAFDPGSLNGQLTAQKSFTPGGLLIWSGVDTITKGSMKVHLDDHPTHASIDAQLAAGNPVLAKVLYENRIWHWVLITGKSATDYLIHDPLSAGSEYERMSAYPRGIYAIRYLEKP